MATKIEPTPSTKGGPQTRASSPCCGFSILYTSAPSSAKIIAAVGAATLVPSSTTTSPESGSDFVTTDILAGTLADFPHYSRAAAPRCVPMQALGCASHNG